MTHPTHELLRPSFRVHSRQQARALVEHLTDLGALPSVPRRLTVDGRIDRPRPERWRDHYPKAKFEVSIRFNEHFVLGEPYMDFDARALVLKGRMEWPVRPAPEDALRLLEQLTFIDCAFCYHYPEWDPSSHVTKYGAPGLDDGHYSHGWACAFQGEGHDRLSSRRWLEQPIWRVLRGKNDTTLVQFHDLDAPWDAAIEQAKPGHFRMGITATGGFTDAPSYRKLDPNGVFKKGIYDPKEKLLRIFVLDREIPPAELLDAVHVRESMKTHPTQPIEAIGYAFMHEEQARKYLHELWLRELRCYAVVGATEVRLDEGYVPPPVQPVQWVRDVESRATPV